MISEWQELISRLSPSAREEVEAARKAIYEERFDRLAKRIANPGLDALIDGITRDLREHDAKADEAQRRRTRVRAGRIRKLRAQLRERPGEYKRMLRDRADVVTILRQYIPGDCYVVIDGPLVGVCVAIASMRYLINLYAVDHHIPVILPDGSIRHMHEDYLIPEPK
jgi:hypothetical protein